MNVKAAINELNKMTEERLDSGFITQGSNENNMRVKFRDLRRILEAMDTPQCDKPKELVHWGRITTQKSSPELKPGYVPEESLRSKLSRVGVWDSTLPMALHVAEQHYAPIIEEARKEGEEKAYKQRYGQGIKFYVEEGKREAIAELKEKYIKYAENYVINGIKTRFFNETMKEVFGPADPKAQGG